MACRSGSAVRSTLGQPAEGDLTREIDEVKVEVAQDVLKVFALEWNWVAPLGV